MICTLTQLETTVALETTGIARYANDDHRKPNMKAKKYTAVEGSTFVQLRALKKSQMKNWYMIIEK